MKLLYFIVYFIYLFFVYLFYLSKYTNIINLKKIEEKKSIFARWLKKSIGLKKIIILKLHYSEDYLCFFLEYNIAN